MLGSLWGAETRSAGMALCAADEGPRADHKAGWAGFSVVGAQLWGLEAGFLIS